MIRRSKSIKQLYDDVKDYDMVITSDAPLRTALNKHLNKPMVGTFAVTPKELAAKYAIQLFREPLLDESEAVIQVAKRLNISIKQAHYIVQRAFDAWQGLVDLERAGQYLSSMADNKAVLNIFRKLPTVYHAMEKFNGSVFKGKKVAVIGLDFFTELDKRVLPEEYTNIEVFTDEEYSLSNFFTLTSERDVVDRVAGMINTENADDIAIVINPESSYLPLIESRLANKGIPMNIRGELKNHFLTRSFLDMVVMGLNIDNLTVREIAPFANLLSAYMDPRYSNYYIPDYVSDINEDAYLSEFYSFLKEITGKSYGNVLNWLGEKGLKFPSEFHDILQRLGMIEKTIDFESYTSLAYCMRNFDIEVAGNRRGTLLINCKNSTYIDRPVCFFLGMDASWTKGPGEEWLDREVKDKRDLNIFQILLQQGQRRYYFASTMKNNEKVIPCYYFNLLFSKAIKDFTDPIFSNKNLLSIENSAGQKRLRLLVKTEPYQFTHFSQSSLRDFVLCPRRYAHGKLKHSQEEAYFLKGRMFHDFAVFYFNRPDIVLEKDDQFFIDDMLKEYKRMTGNLKLDVERTDFSIGIQNILSFIDSLDDVDEEPEIEIPSVLHRVSDNRFARLLGIPLEKPNCELSFADDELCIEGRFDLMVNPYKVVDFKSGRKGKTAAEIVKNADCCTIVDMEFGDGEEETNIAEEKLDFQPMFYLLMMRKLNQNENIEFQHYYCLANYRQVINGESDDISKNIVTIGYHPIDYNKSKKKESFCKDDLDDFEIFIKQKIIEINKYLRDGFPAKPLSKSVCKKCICADTCLGEE